MTITNVTKGVVLAEQAAVADTIFSRLKGLLGRKELGVAEALLITPSNSIHTFFMRFPIDILFVDKNNTVVAAINAFPAFRISKIYFRSICVIELPAGTIKATATSEGDTLSFH